MLAMPESLYGAVVTVAPYWLDCAIFKGEPAHYRKRVRLSAYAIAPIVAPISVF
jgi:hypothetical protein